LQSSQLPKTHSADLRVGIKYQPHGTGAQPIPGCRDCLGNLNCESRRDNHQSVPWTSYKRDQISVGQAERNVRGMIAHPDLRE